MNKSAMLELASRLERCADEDIQRARDGMTETYTPLTAIDRAIASYGRAAALRALAKEKGE